MKRNRKTRRIYILIAVLLLMTSVASAQEESGSLYGTVVDATGGPLPGVTVTLSGMGSQIQYSDVLGKFRFLKLAPGSWSLEASLDGFSRLEYPGIDIRAGRNTTLELQLTAAVEEVITVTSESPLLDERKVSQGSVLTQLDLEAIPTARDPWAVLNQAPGVMVDRIDVGGSRAQQAIFTAPGIEHHQNDFVLDGVQVTNMDGGGPTTYFEFDQFSQIELSTGGNEIAKTTAGVSINMVTKRGTNEFRGSARFLLTDDDIFLFFKQSSPNVDPDAFPPGQEEVETTQIDKIEDYGFEAGGPAIRDRLWFWGSYGRNLPKEIQVGGFPKNTSIESAAFKLNAQPSGANSLLASWNNTDKQVPNRLHSLFRALEAAWDQRGPTALIKLEDTHVFGSNFFLTGSWGKVDSGWSATANSCIAAGHCDDAPEFLQDADGVRRGSYLSFFLRDPQEQWQLDGSYFFSTARTSHELKFGGRFREYDITSPAFWPGGRNVGHIAGDYLGLPSELGLFFAMRGAGPPVSQDYTSLWVQDTLSVGGWTVNAGLRFDHQQGTNEPIVVQANPAVPELMPALEYPGSDGPEWESISPRIGVTYAMGTERQTLLRGSYARFASSLRAFDTRRTNPVGWAYTTFLFYDTNENDLWEAEEDYFLVAWDNIDPANPTALTSPNRTDPNLEPELTDEIVVGVEQALRPELIVGLNVTWRNTQDKRERRRYLRECETEGCDTGPERLARREDYELFTSVEVEHPDGQPYLVDYYALRDGLAFTGGDLRINGEREVEYLGGSLTLTKRLSNQWMLRGFIHYGRGEWDIPESFFEFDDPTDEDAFFVGRFDNDGDVFAESAGKWGQAFLHSTWSFNLNGMYQVAPNRPWGFNVAGNIYGREGYPMPFWTEAFVPGHGTRYAQAVEMSDDFRYEDIYTVDLRIEKEFAASGNMSLTASADLFNAFNEGFVLERDMGLNVPTANYVLETLSPRIWRLGVRLNWR